VRIGVEYVRTGTSRLVDILWEEGAAMVFHPRAIVRGVLLAAALAAGSVTFGADRVVLCEEFTNNG
jgi:hypothetical protein